MRGWQNAGGEELVSGRGRTRCSRKLCQAIAEDMRLSPFHSPRALPAPVKCFQLLISLRLVSLSVVWHTNKRRVVHHNAFFVEAPALVDSLIASGAQLCSLSELQHDPLKIPLTRSDPQASRVHDGRRLVHNKTQTHRFGKSATFVTGEWEIPVRFRWVPSHLFYASLPDCVLLCSV